MTFNVTKDYITKNWIGGFIEAEGSFIIYFQKTNNKLVPRFSFYLSQKSEEPLKDWNLY